MKHIGKTLFGCLMATLLLASLVACSAGAPTGTTAPASATATPAATTSAAPTDAVASASAQASAPVSSAKDWSKEPAISVDVYAAFANFQGVQPGWFGKVVKDKFNMELNLIAPNVAGGGDQLYTTRTAAGNLGDLIILDNAKLKECYSAGLLMDITSYFANATNLQKYALANQNIATFMGTGDKVFAFPNYDSTLPLTTPQLDVQNLNLAPYMRWDYYKELGYPAMNNLDDVLTVLKQMQDKHPTSESGKKVYGISFFKDWDGTYSAWMAKFANMYGFREMANFTFMNADATQTQLLTDDNSVYYKVLKWLFKANQMGLLDPDSPSATWDTTASKVKDGAILFNPWPWNCADAVNTKDKGDQGIGWAMVPVKDMTFLADGVNPYGTGSSTAIGSKAKDPERLVMFEDWMASPEGMQMANDGPEGLLWAKKDGKPVLTDWGKTAKALNAPVPDQYGGGTWNDGGNQLHDGPGYANDINPDTNEPYSSGLWSSTIADNQTALTKDWSTQMNAQNPQDYVTKNNMLAIYVGNTYVQPRPSSDLQTKINQCGTVVKTASWQMIFAPDQAGFDAIWTDMKTQLAGLGYDEVNQLSQTFVDGYKQAIAATKAGAAK